MPPNDPATLGGSDPPVTASSLDVETSLADAQQIAVAETDQNRLYEHKHRQRQLVRFGLLGLLAFLVIGVLGIVLFRSGTQTNSQLGNFPVTRVQLPALPKTTLATENAQELQVNGQLQANNSIVLTPTATPSNPVSGQIYYDKGTNRLLYYNGDIFTSLGNFITNNVANNSYVTQNIYNNTYNTQASNTTIINQSSSADPAILLQGNTPGAAQAGNFNISGTGIAGQLKASVLSSTSSLLTVSSPTLVKPSSNSTAAFQVQNAAGDNFLAADTLNNTVVLGKDATASPTKITVRGGAAVGNNLKGSDLVIEGGNGTGVGGSGDIIFNTAEGVSNPIPTIDATSVKELGAQSNTTITWSHTTGTNSGRAIIVAIDTATGGGLVPILANNVTYDGRPLIKLAELPSPGGQTSGSVWYLPNPASGTHIMSATLPAGDPTDIGIIATSFYNVDDSDPIASYAAVQQSGAGINTQVLNTNAGQLIFDAIMTRGNWGNQAVMGTGQQTSAWLGYYNDIIVTSYKRGASGSTSMSWSNNGSAVLNHVAIALRPMPNLTPDPMREAFRITQAGTIGVNLDVGESTQATIGLGGSADRVIAVNQNLATGAGHSLTIQGGGAAVGNYNGGDLVLQGGFGTGTGLAGSVVVRPATNGLAFQIQDAASTALLTADTNAMTVSINNALVVGVRTLTPAIDSIGVLSTLTIGAGNAAVINIGSNSADHAINIGTGAGSQNIIIGYNGGGSTNSGTYIRGGPTGIHLQTDWVADIRIGDTFQVLNQSGDILLSAANDRVVTIPWNAFLRVDGDAVYEKGITINPHGLYYTSPQGFSFTTAINVPNYTLGAYASIVALGLDATSPDSARGILVADARATSHQPTIGVLNVSEDDILGFSWDGSATTGKVRTLGSSSIAISPGGNDVSTFSSNGQRLSVNSNTALAIQNTSAITLFTADTNNMVITVGGTNSNYASLTLSNAHVKSTQTIAPTLGIPTNCGTSPTASTAAGATDSAGTFTITTGSGGTSSTCETTLTFHQAYAAEPKSIIIVGKSSVGAVQRQIYVSSATASSFTTSFATSAGGANSTAYTFNYWVIE